MRNIIILILITTTLSYTNAANHYVDKNASGSNNGTSWSNAWQNLSNVQWSTLGAGDTLFISGGTSSTIYNETLTIGASGNANGLLVVTKGRTTGHNGEVILDGGNTGFGIYVQNDQYVKVSDLTIRNMDLGARILDPANVIRIENCNMYNLHGGGIDISGYNGTYNTDQVDSVFIVNCSVVSHETNGNQTDGIDIAYCQNIFITDSYVSVDNVGEAHTDIIQTYQIAKNVTLKRNRLENLIDKTINPSSGANGLMMDKLVGTITIDNNVLRTPNFNAGAGICAALFAYSQSDPPLVYFYNNTCIWDNATNAFSFGSSSYPVASGSKYKNNIFYSTGLTGGADPVNFGPNSSCSNVSNNIFYSSAGSWSGGSNCSSPHANPMFTNPGSDWTLQGGSPAIDAGIDLGSEYQKDRAGNLRTGTWDLGAYEYVGGGGGNNPPNPPTNPNPGNGAVNQPTSLTLTWSCTDPNGDPLTYDVYFGTTNNPPLVSGNQTGTTYNPGGLSNSTTYYWKIVAKDNHGASTAGPVWSFSTAAAGNNPPNQPSNPNPGNGAVNQPTSLTLTWSCTDPNGDPLTYDVYFGTSNNPPLVSGNRTSASYNPGGLSNSTTYYWKIVAKDNHGASTAGPVWSFTTAAAANNPPNQPTNPNPGNGAVNQPTSLTLTWSCTDPNGDPLTYDVYFGTTNNPPLVSGNRTSASYNPGGLNNSTTYYWKIVAKDNHGASTAGPVWSFTTAAAGNNPPNQPSNPNPGNSAVNQPINLTLTWSCSDPNGDSLTYDIYFGTANNPPLVSGNRTSASYNPGGLSNSTTYYWKITAKDNHGGSTAGPVWNFSTISDTSSGDTAAVNANIKVFLEGPYTNNAMYTYLSNSSLVPTSQPYTGQPWNYAGNENVNAVPQNIVDWILIELRTSTGASSVVGRRAAFLRNDGMAVDLNGQTKISFPGVQSGQYYLVIFHRNHLAIMSKNRVLLADSSSLYDFTISENRAYGNLPMKSLGNSKFGLYAADGNANGNINNTDYSRVWKRENGSLGYKDGDFDLNGGVNIVDKNSKWSPNKGKNTQVP